jgi:hypothetical protein
MTDTESVQAVRLKIFGWLRDIKAEPENIIDKNAHFNIRYKIGAYYLIAAQPLTVGDAITLYGSSAPTDQQLAAAYKDFDETRHGEFMNDIKLYLLAMGEVGNYELKTNPQGRFVSLELQSKQIFYDGLTKDRLVSVSLELVKAMLAGALIFENHFGKLLPPPTGGLR